MLSLGCTRSNPERELREAITRMASAIEQRQPGDFVGALADDFTRESGGFDKQEVRRVLAAVMLRNARIGVTSVVTSMQVEGDRARVQLRVVATGGDGLLPERGQTWEIDSAWRRDGNRWKVFNAEWREGL